MSDFIIKPTPAIDSDFDPAGSTLTSINTEDAIKELSSNAQAAASPGYFFSRNGILGPETYLLAGANVSSKTGLPMLLNTPIVKKVVCAATFESTYSVSIYYHFGNQVGETLVGTVNVTPGNRVFVVNWTGMPSTCQVSCKVTAGSVKNLDVSLVIKGELA